MSKKRNKAAQKAQQQAVNKKRTNKKTASSFWQQSKQAIMVLAGLAFALYIYSVSFEYALDDQLYITSNQFTKEGIAGIYDIMTTESLVGFFGKQKDLLAGGRYRPLAIATYAIEYQFFQESPGFTHFVNILLYCLTAIILYRLLLMLIPPEKERKWYLSLAFITTALFIAHPIHTEVIANIKGRVELLALLFALLTVFYSVKYVRLKQVKYLIFSGIVFFLALLSKESPITFLAVIPLTLYFFTKASVKDYITTMSPLLGVLVLFFLIRKLVLGYFISSGVVVNELLNDPFLEASVGDRYATVFYTLGKYIQLLFAPITLTHDYYPKQIPIIGWTDWRALTSFVLYIAIGLGALYGIYKKHLIGYGLAFFLITLSIVSNVFVNIGTFMNERFLYIPSIGFCLILAYILVKILPNYIKPLQNTKVLTYLLIGILTLYGLRTLVRIPAWKNNETLFLTDVKTSTNSTKCNTSAGGTLLEKAVVLKNPSRKDQLLGESIGYLKKALELYPNNPNALMLLGSAYFERNKDYKNAFDNYYHLLTINKNHKDIHRILHNMADVEEEPKNVDILVDFLENKVIPLEPNTFQPYKALGALYGKKKNNLNKALEYLNKAAGFKNASEGTFQDLAVAYGMKQDYPKSIEAAKKALAINPKNSQVLLNLGITYQNMGDTIKANKYINDAKAINPQLGRRN